MEARRRARALRRTRQQKRRVWAGAPLPPRCAHWTHPAGGGGPRRASHGPPLLAVLLPTLLLSCCAWPFFLRACYSPSPRGSLCLWPLLGRLPALFCARPSLSGRRATTSSQPWLLETHCGSTRLQHTFGAAPWLRALSGSPPSSPPPSRRPPHHSHSSRQCRPVQSKKAVNHVAGREGNPPTPQPVVRRPDGGRRRPLPSMLRKRPNTNKQGGPHKTRQGPRPLRKADDHPILPPTETTQDVGRTYRWVPCDIPASQPPTPPRAQHADPRNQRAAPQPVDPLRRPQRPGVDAYFRTVGGHDNSPTSSPPPT